MQKKATQKTSKSGNALAKALRFEKTGWKYYLAAAKKAADPHAGHMFELLAGMEEKHVRDILAISAAVQESGKFPTVSTAPFDERARQFKREHARIRKEKVVSTDSASAMRKALGLEAEGREMYIRMADGASAPQERRFFGLLAAEEESHFKIIYEYLDSLENIGLRMGE